MYLVYGGVVGENVEWALEIGIIMIMRLDTNYVTLVGSRPKR